MFVLAAGANTETGTAGKTVVVIIIPYIIRPLQKSKLAAVCLRKVCVILFLEFDFPSLFCVFHRAEKTEVLSDDLLQVKIPHMQNCAALAFKHLHFA